MSDIVLLHSFQKVAEAMKIGRIAVGRPGEVGQVFVLRALAEVGEALLGLRIGDALSGHIERANDMEPMKKFVVSGVGGEDRACVEPD